MNWRMARLLWNDRRAMVTQSTTHYKQGMHQNIYQCTTLDLDAEGFQQQMPFLSATTRCWGCISHGLTRAPLRCPKVCKKCFHAITPWALILYFNVVYTKLWPHHPEVATERETPQTRQHFPVFCSFILNLIWTTGNLRLNWCCNWKLLHHKLAGNSSCCDLTCNYISHKCKRCRSLWRCIKMGFQLS